MQDWNKILRAAVRRDKRSLNQLAADAGMNFAPLHRFSTGKQGLTLTSAAGLAASLGYKLVKVKGK